MSVEIVASDLEGTLSAGSAWQGLRAYLLAHGYEAGFKQFNRKFVLEYMMVKVGLRNEQAFKEKWLLGLLQLYADFTEAEFAEVAEWVVDQEIWPKRRLNVAAELADHQANGRSVIIVTGVFQPILDNFAARLGMEAIGTGMAFDENSRFTGKISTPLNIGEQKLVTLHQRFGDAPLYAAYGDTAADIPMLKMSTHPVAVSPDKKLRALAETENWRILE